MIKVNDIKKIVKLVLISGYLQKTAPLNLLLVGTPGVGKTDIIKNFKPTASFDVFSDLNYTAFLDLLVKKRRLKHLIIPDFIKITHKKSSTSINFISGLNTAMEEGLYKVLGYTNHNFKGRKIGLITATTKASLGQHRKDWGSMGFLDRMIICSYSYSKATAEEIKSYVNEELFKKIIPEIMKTKGGETLKITEVTSTKILNSEFNESSKKSIRTLKQFQTLAKCNALNESRTKVLKEDVEEILRLTKYLNQNYTEI